MCKSININIVDKSKDTSCVDKKEDDWKEWDELIETLKCYRINHLRMGFLLTFAGIWMLGGFGYAILTAGVAMSMFGIVKYSVEY